jgi:PPOX class probable FMN-dependent enzyme
MELDRAGIDALYPAPLPLALLKQIDRLDGHCRHFIGLSPFLCIGTADASGRADVSPRGDQPGFVQVLDDRHLAIPDRPGNNRLDSLKNVAENPEVALIFFVPGVEETLRVNGTAAITHDAELLAGMAVEGKLPRSALIVTVREAYLHCAKALKRSHLWDAGRHVPPGTVPSLAKIVTDHANIPDRLDEVAARTEEAYRTKLY